MKRGQRSGEEERAQRDGKGIHAIKQNLACQRAGELVPFWDGLMPPLTQRCGDEIDTGNSGEGEL